MVYPNFLRNTYKLIHENSDLTHTVYVDFYADFVTHYLNRHVFTRLTNGEKVWYDWNRSVEIDVTEKVALNAVFNLTQPIFLLPAITDETDDAYTSHLLRQIVGVMMNIFPLFNKKDWASLIKNNQIQDKKWLTKEAQTLIFEADVVSFTPPVLFDGSEIPNFLVGVLKTIEKSPTFFNSYETYENNSVRQIVEKRLDSHEVYGYRSHMEVDRAKDFARSTILYGDLFLKTWSKYINIVPWSLKNRFKMNFIPSIKNSYHKLVIASGSVATATAGAAMVFPTASTFIVGGVAGAVTLAGAGKGVNTLITHVPDADKGWLVLTPESKQLLRQIDAWERFKDSTIGVPNRYDGYSDETTRKI